MTLLGFQPIKGQISPCVTYDQKRTMAQFKNLILYGKDPFIWRQLWPEYARLGNMILQTSKDSSVRTKVLSADQKSMQWLMDHSKDYAESFYDWSDYRNAGREKDQLIYTNSKGLPSSWVVLSYKDVEGMYAKLACGNAEDPKEYKSYTPPPTIVTPPPVVVFPPPVVPKKDTVYLPTPPVKKRLPELVTKEEKKPVRDTVFYFVKETKTIIHEGGNDWSRPVGNYYDPYRPRPQVSFWINGSNNRQSNYQPDRRFDPQGLGGGGNRWDPPGG